MKWVLLIVAALLLGLLLVIIPSFVPTAADAQESKRLMESLVTEAANKGVQIGIDSIQFSPSRGGTLLYISGVTNATERATVENAATNVVSSSAGRKLRIVFR